MDNTFEENYKKIEELLDQLENNKDNLDESIAIYKKANDIYKTMKGQLDDYKAKIEIIDTNE